MIGLAKTCLKHIPNPWDQSFKILTPALLKKENKSSRTESRWHFQLYALGITYARAQPISRIFASNLAQKPTNKEDHFVLFF